jgi:uncharacterized protein YrzB (UPF0473 family)
MANTENNDHIIETVDEHGKHVKFELIDIVELDEVEYGLLYPVEGFGENPEQKVVVMRLKQDGEDFIFEKIEDDEEFDRVADYVAEVTEAQLAEDENEN